MARVGTVFGHPYEDEPCEAAHNLNWMTYLYDGISTKTNIQNKDISEKNLIEAIALDKGSLNIEFSLKTMYIANSRQFKRSEVHDNIVICISKSIYIINFLVI